MILISNLVLAGSKAMNVDGSSDVKTFSYSPDEGITVNIVSLLCILEDAGTSSYGRFGSIAALTNGILIELLVDGAIHQISVINDNADIVTRFPDCVFGSPATDAIGNSTGFGNSPSAFLGELRFNSPLRLSSMDSVRVTVRDNLSNIGTLNFACKATKES